MGLKVAMQSCAVARHGDREPVESVWPARVCHFDRHFNYCHNFIALGKWQILEILYLSKPLVPVLSDKV